MLPLEQRRTERISFGVTKTQKAAFLINAAEAGMSSNDYARAVLCAPGLRDAGARAGHGAARASAFELVDALARIGADLARLKFIAEQTGIVPDDLNRLIAQLDSKLDNLVVASGLAEELRVHRDRLDTIAERLESSGQMTERARGMIATFDAVVRKVLSS